MGLKGALIEHPLELQVLKWVSRLSFFIGGGGVPIVVFVGVIRQPKGKPKSSLGVQPRQKPGFSQLKRNLGVCQNKALGLIPCQQMKKKPAQGGPHLGWIEMWSKAHFEKHHHWAPVGGHKQRANRALSLSVKDSSKTHCVQMLRPFRTSHFPGPDKKQVRAHTSPCKNFVGSFELERSNFWEDVGSVDSSRYRAAPRSIVAARPSPSSSNEQEVAQSSWLNS